MPPENCADTATLSRTPATVALAVVQGDDFPFAININRDLTGYTYSAEVACVETGLPVCQMAIAPTPGATTRIVLSLSEAQTAVLLPPLTYRWSLRWTSPTGDTRTILAGRVRTQRR